MQAPKIPSIFKASSSKSFSFKPRYYDEKKERREQLEKGNKDALTVLIKADDKAIYKNVIDLIDELNVCLVGKYAVVDMMPTELELLNITNK